MKYLALRRRNLFRKSWYFSECYI